MDGWMIDNRGRNHKDMCLCVRERDSHTHATNQNKAHKLTHTHMHKQKDRNQVFSITLLHSGLQTNHLSLRPPATILPASRTSPFNADGHAEQHNTDRTNARIHPEGNFDMHQHCIRGCVEPHASPPHHAHEQPECYPRGTEADSQRPWGNTHRAVTVRIRMVRRR